MVIRMLMKQVKIWRAIWQYLVKLMTQIKKQNCRMKCLRYHLCKSEITKYDLRYKNVLLTSRLGESINI